MRKTGLLCFLLMLFTMFSPLVSCFGDRTSDDADGQTSEESDSFSGEGDMTVTGLRKERDGLFLFTLANGKTVTADFNYYPGYTRKAITFSYDDGNRKYDSYVTALLRDYGFRGTFMIAYGGRTAAELELYEGHEVGNHSSSHNENYKKQEWPLSLLLSDVKRQSDCLNEALGTLLSEYPDFDVNRAVSAFAIPYTTDYRFLSEVTERSDNEALAGMFSAAGAPLDEETLAGMTDGEICFAYFRAIGITNSRRIPYGKGYDVNIKNDFDLPYDFLLWEPTMHQSALKSEKEEEYVNAYATQYEELPEDGKLKVFYVWGHPSEIDSSGIAGGTLPGTPNKNLKYRDLEGFLSFFSGDDYYKATLSEIERYAAAVRGLCVKNGAVVNLSDTDIYMTVTVNGEAEELVLPAGGEYRFTWPDE